MKSPVRLLSALIVVGLPRIVSAEPTVTARVSATDMTMGSQITLSVEVSGVGNVNGTPNLTLPDFETQAAGQTSSYQWINGQTSALVTFNYILSPTRSGQLQIPSIALNVGGKTYSTQPITVNVRPDSSPPSSAGAAAEPAAGQVQVPAEGLKPVFMTATVDSDKVTVGQQILLKVQFLKRPGVRLSSQPQYSAPDMTGFLVEPLKQQDFTTAINGARYEVNELPYALFPTSDGNFAIGSARIELAVRSEPDPFDPNTFFQSFFGRSEVAHLNTRAIPIRVRSLPVGKPANFSGSVGRFKINAKVDTTQPEVGKPFNLIISVEGVGNIKAIKEPFLPELRGFRRYETISNFKVSTDGRFLSGGKEFKILLIPQVSGQLTIPSASFVYFNPAKNDYVVESAPEISLNVKPGSIMQTDQENQAPMAVSGQPSAGVRVLEKDIRFIKSGSVRPMSRPLYQRPLFLLFNFLPPLFALGALLSRRQSMLRKENADEYRAKKAIKIARKKLAKAQKMVKSGLAESFYGVLHGAVAGYLADKFSLSAAGLLWEDVEQRFIAKQVDPGLRSEIREIFDQADMARFASSSFSDESRESALVRAEQVISRLNEVLR